MSEPKPMSPQEAVRALRRNRVTASPLHRIAAADKPFVLVPPMLVTILLFIVKWSLGLFFLGLGAKLVGPNVTNGLFCLLIAYLILW